MSRTILERPEAGEQGTVATEPVVRSAASKKRKMLLIWSGVVILLIGLAAGLRYLVWSAHHESTDDAYLAGHLHPISARITDTVERVLIDDNQHVVQGQTLV